MSYDAFQAFLQAASPEIKSCHARQQAFTKLLEVQQELLQISIGEIQLWQSQIDDFSEEDSIPYQEKIVQAIADVQKTNHEIQDCQNKLQVIGQNQEYAAWLQLMDQTFPPFAFASP